MKTFNRFHEWHEYLERLDIKVEIKYANNKYTAYDISGKMHTVIGRFSFDTNTGWVQS